MISLNNNTPVEKYGDIYVKREDLATPFPGPPFSKVRGLVPVLERLKKEGKRIIGYTETSVSMAGWGVAWACKELGMKAIIFDPQYKETPDLLKYHRGMWYTFGTQIISIKAGMAKVNWNISRNILKEKFGEEAVLLPLGLPFPETIKATTDEVIRTRKTSQIDFSTIVVNIGSGTVCAGVLKGFPDKIVYGIMGRSGNVEQKKKKILEKAGFVAEGLFNNSPDFRLCDPGWEYTEQSKSQCPFPCHPWYDAKAWSWLMEKYDILKSPILFWNIGALPEGWNK